MFRMTRVKMKSSVKVRFSHCFCSSASVGILPPLLWVSYILLCESDKKMHFCGKKFGFFEIPRRYCHTDSQAAGAAVSITSMQNWPHGQIRFCYAKSVGERQVNSCSNPGKPLGFPKTCDNFFKLPLQAGFVRSERCSWFDGCTFAKEIWIF